MWEETLEVMEGFMVDGGDSFTDVSLSPNASRCMCYIRSFVYGTNTAMK